MGDTAPSTPTTAQFVLLPTSPVMDIDLGAIDHVMAAGELHVVRINLMSSCPTRPASSAAGTSSSTVPPPSSTPYVVLRSVRL